MKTITLTKMPRHGLLSLDIPHGAPWRQAALPCGAPLNSQWIPAPFDSAFSAGRLLVKVPGGARELLLDASGGASSARSGSDWVCVEEGLLTLDVGGLKLPLCDTLANRPLDHVSAVEYNIAFDAQKGSYPMFAAGSAIDTVSDGPVATVVRVKTALKEQKTGADFHGAVAAYDIVRYKDIPLVEITACFEAREYALAQNLSFAALRLPLSTAKGWAGGMPLSRGLFEDDETSSSYANQFLARSLSKFMSVETERGPIGYVGAHPLVKIDGGDVLLVGDTCGLDRDIREYGPGEGLRANLFYAAREGAGGLEGWIGELPCFMRPCEEIEDVFELRAGDLTVMLRALDDGVDIVGMRDERTGEMLLKRGRNKLFSLLFRETADMAREHMINSLSGWGRVALVPGADDVTVIFSEPKDAALEGVGAVLHAACDRKLNRISWELDVRNLSARLSLIASDYPSMYYAVDGVFNTLCNQDCGRVRRDMADAACHVHYRYPAMSGCMQYQAVWREDTGRGLYYGVHDPEGVTKHLFSEVNAYSRSGNMRFFTESLGTGEPMNGQKLPGAAVWQLFDGDWYDASMIYRDWVLPNASWVPRISAGEGRADTPKWMREVPIWFNQSIGTYDGIADPEVVNGKWADELIEARRDLGIPAAVHMYNWHQIPFDNDYPHYKPAKLTFIENIDRLHEADIKVMPYINGRLWDTHDRREKDWRFTKEARPWATTTYFGEPYLEQYLSKEVDGSPVCLSPMCPTTALWQEKQVEICDWLMNDIGVDAVYLDQIAAGQPVLCMNKNHAHRPGNGSWWQYGYYNLMEHLKRKTPEGRGYTTEANAEIYMRAIDSYLTWGWVEDGQVPSFAAVYAGYVGLFGRCYSPDTSDNLRILAGQALLFGEQIGWISPSSYLKSPYRALYRKIARTRHAYTRYLSYGRMGRPPVLTGDIPSIVTPCYMGEPNMLVWPAAMGAMWQRNDTGERILILENLADDAVAVDVCADLSGTVAGTLAGDLSGSVELVDGKCSLTLPAQSVVVVELK